MTPPNGASRLDGPLSLPERPLVSVVIPTLNEEQHITTLLDSLSEQDYGPRQLEVLVADGGSEDATRALVREYPSRFHRLEVVDNPMRITVGGLNAGMAVAAGDCWIIIGAHSEVAPDFVSASVSALRRTGAACVGGPIETIGRSFVGKAIAAAMSSPFGVGDARFRYSEEGGEVDTVPFGCYHRRVWEVVGPFDETVDGADEDSYNARLRRAGGRIVLDPAIRSSYYPRESLRALAEQYAGYGAAKGTLLRRGETLRPRHFAPSAMVVGGGLLLLLGRRRRSARRLLRLLGSAYVGLGMRAGRSAGEKNGAHPALVLGAAATMHAAYGVGFLWGLATGTQQVPGTG